MITIKAKDIPLSSKSDGSNDPDLSAMPPINDLERQLLRFFKASVALRTWLREEELLDSKYYLLELDPLQQCPASIPLGQKIALQQFIRHLKRNNNSQGVAHSEPDGGCTVSIILLQVEY